MQSKSGKHYLNFDLGVERQNEQTVLGGLKTKDIDLVVTKPGVGPVIGISVKGTGGAFRNLTNRMEEAIGDSTNLHIMYPGFVYGFLHVLKAHRAGTEGLDLNDIAIDRDGEVVQSVRRYHDVLLGLAGRKYIRDDFTRYEAVCLALVDPAKDSHGTFFTSFPPPESPLNFAAFFDTVYRIYDLRFPYLAASLSGLKRLVWDASSPALACFGDEAGMVTGLGYRPRLA